MISWLADELPGILSFLLLVSQTFHTWCLELQALMLVKAGAVLTKPSLTSEYLMLKQHSILNHWCSEFPLIAKGHACAMPLKGGEKAGDNLKDQQLSVIQLLKYSLSMQGLCLQFFPELPLGGLN